MNDEKLPEEFEEELAGFRNLTDDELWRIARTSLSLDEQAELADLNDEAKSRDLTIDEEERCDALLDVYNCTMVRRAEAAFILRARGYNLSDPAVLTP